MATLFTYKDAEKMTMKCPNEDTIYPSPENMYDEHGKKLYAYVTLVMLGDLYIAAAIVLAHSLRKLNTKADLVILVTPDVTESGKQCLRKYFDLIVEIDYVSIKNWRTKVQPHRQYLNYVFTRFHVFNLLQYKKIIMIDADAIVMKYPDHLFTLDAPAGCFLRNKEKIITYDKEGNYILPKENTFKWYKEYCDCCGHNVKIPKSETDLVMINRKNPGIGGGIMVVEPKKGELDSIVKDISRGKMWKMVNERFIWPEQQYLTARYSGRWTGINPRFFGLQGYPHWKVLYGLQYGGDKPFTLNSKMKLEDRINYPDYILWHHMFDEIITDNPDFIKEKALKEPLQMNMYFKQNNKSTKQLKRANTISVNVETITKSLGIQQSNINPEHIPYYHLDTSKGFNPIKVKPMFDNIEPYHFIEPIKELSKYYPQSYYFKNLINKCKDKISSNKLLNTSKLLREDMDQIMLQYVKCRPNCFVFTLWPLAVPYMDKLIKFLSNHGNVYYRKQINLTFNGVQNLMFNMYGEFTRKARQDFIKKKLSYSQIKIQGENNIGVIIFDNVQNKRLSGQGSFFKRTIRDFLMDFMDNKDDLRGNDLIHINDHFYETIHYAQLLFNDNSLHVLDKMNLCNSMHPFFNRAFLKFNTVKKWLNDHVSLVDMNRFCFLSGEIFYAHGIRPSNDIDCIILNRKTDEKEKQFHQLIEKNFINPTTKFKFADMGIEESQSWKTQWTEKNAKILKILNIPTFTEVIFNPKHHFYFGGFKCWLLEYVIVKKWVRGGRGDYGDLSVLYLKYKDIIGNLIVLTDKNKLKMPSYGKPFPIEYLDDTFKSIKRKYLRSDTQDITKDVIKELLL